MAVFCCELQLLNTVMHGHVQVTLAFFLLCLSMPSEFDHHHMAITQNS